MNENIESKHADELMRNMTEANPQMNILFDVNFSVIDCNPSALRFMGFADKESMFEVLDKRKKRVMPDFFSSEWNSTMLIEKLATAARKRGRQPKYSPTRRARGK